RRSLSGTPRDGPKRRCQAGIAAKIGRRIRHHRERPGFSMARQLSGPLIVATHNPGQLREMRELLAPYGIATQPAGELGLPEPEETGTTFAENARIKAVAAAGVGARRACAEDAGVVVDALDGEPGIHSARWAGPDKDFRAAMNRIQT